MFIKILIWRNYLINMFNNVNKKKNNLETFNHNKKVLHMLWQMLKEMKKIVSKQESKLVWMILKLYMNLKNFLMKKIWLFLILYH